MLYDNVIMGLICILLGLNQLNLYKLRLRYCHNECVLKLTSCTVTQ